jgi:hypothetical protein
VGLLRGIGRRQSIHFIAVGRFQNRHPDHPLHPGSWAYCNTLNRQQPAACSPQPAEDLDAPPIINLQAIDADVARRCNLVLIAEKPCQHVI